MADIPPKKTIAITKPAQKGAVTHNHDHAITPVNFNTMNTIPKTPNIGILTPLFG